MRERAEYLEDEGLIWLRNSSGAWSGRALHSTYCSCLNVGLAAIERQRRRHVGFSVAQDVDQQRRGEAVKMRSFAWAGRWWRRSSPPGRAAKKNARYAMANARRAAEPVESASFSDPGDSLGPRSRRQRRSLRGPCPLPRPRSVAALASLLCPDNRARPLCPCGETPYQPQKCQPSYPTKHADLSDATGRSRGPGRGEARHWGTDSAPRSPGKHATRLARRYEIVINSGMDTLRC